ncbi:hypothetical protein HPB49_012100 [Dermacentor silvarum]|uniref:Uncharacterized protein n=1 Tax=Dermacentor silvarum TaxID=543639 RepID=A0ACB8E0A2_DERSI|nr:hypothetical protein HPB49_012100 [Dermacentor silvarum]
MPCMRETGCCQEDEEEEGWWAWWLLATLEHKGAAGAAAGAAPHCRQVAMAQGAGRSAAERAAQDKAVGATEANGSRCTLPAGALHLLMGMPNASSIVSTAP